MPFPAVCLLVSAQQVKAFVSYVHGAFLQVQAFPTAAIAGDGAFGMAACQESLDAEDVPRDFHSKSVTCLSPQRACEPWAKACHAFGQTHLPLSLVRFSHSENKMLSRMLHLWARQHFIFRG